MISNKNIIFIISQPRSGSTLLLQRIGKHSEIHVMGEPWYLLPVFKNDFEINKVNKKTIYNANTANSALKEFYKLAEDTNGIKRDSELFFYKSILTSIIDNSNKQKIIDKTPRYYYIVEEIKFHFPNSKIIIIYRNPLAVFSSMLKTWTKGNYPLVLKLKDDLLKAPYILAQYKKEKQPNIFKLNYEDLVLHSNDTLRDVLAFLDLEFEESVVNNFNNLKKFRLGDPLNAATKKKIDDSSLSKWKKELRPQEWKLLKDYIELLGKNTLNEFGYSYDHLKKELVSIKPSKLSLLFTFSLKFYFSRFSGTVIFPVAMFIRKLKRKIYE
jgi:hypothetical protein